jgi:hypothetical protein
MGDLYDSAEFPIVLQANDKGRGVCPFGFWAIFRSEDFNENADFSICNVLTSDRTISNLHEDQESKPYAEFTKYESKFSLINKTNKQVEFVFGESGSGKRSF